MTAWWQRITDALWLRIDLAMYAAHRRRCTDCRAQRDMPRDQLADDQWNDA